MSRCLGVGRTIEIEIKCNVWYFYYAIATIKFFRFFGALWFKKSYKKKKTIHVKSYYLSSSNRVCLMISWEIINVNRPKLNPRQQVFNTNKSIAKRWFSIQFITRSKMKNTLLNSSGITFCLVIFKFDKFVASIQEQLYFCFILTRIFVNDIISYNA